MSYQSWPTYNMGRPTYQSGQFRIRPVSSLEEVKASPIDFDGSVFYFHDIGNKKIYTKQFSLNGTMLIEAYGYEEIKPAVPASPIFETAAANFLTKDEFQQAIDLIVSKLDGGKKNEQSVSNDVEFNL